MQYTIYYDVVRQGQTTIEADSREAAEEKFYETFNDGDYEIMDTLEEPSNK